LETKRFIGNDMNRIFARVRRELGPDAVVVQTRSLLREGADPLIEVLASASPEAGHEDALTLALQRVMIQGSLDAAERPSSRGLTVGDLEDIAARERQEADALREFDAAYSPAQAASAELQTPDWLEGFVQLDEATVREVAPEPEFLDALPPFQAPDVVPPAPIEWTPRPRIGSRKPVEMPQPNKIEPHAPAAALRGFTPVEPGIAGRLVAAGFSAEAARRIAQADPDAVDPAVAFEAALSASEVQYPVENRTAIITIQGAPGSGRTTALMRMALDCADSGREAVLVAADTSHTGGRAQVHAYGEAIGLAVFDAFSPRDLVQAVTRAPRGACIFVDVPPGPWSPPPVPGVRHFVYLAVPAHWQPRAIEQALADCDPATCAGAVLTGTDIATELTPAISLLVESQLGIAFLSSGRDVGTGITVADPAALASGVFTTSTRETTNGRLAVTA
jgi:flagellar biosynthesis GTPase FlhF